MKILISEEQYIKMVMELRNHPENHDIEQRKLRMGKLNEGIPLVLDYQDYEKILIPGQKSVDKAFGPVKSEIIGKYVLTPDVATIINQRLDNIYKYDFSRIKSYAVLVYDFVLDSNNVRSEKITYNGEDANEQQKIKNHVNEIMKKKTSHNASISFTQYEPVDKKDPYSPMSDDFRAHYMVLLIDRNDAITVMLTSKNQWDTKTFYGYAKQPIQEYIRYDQISAHATPLPSYAKELASIGEKKPNDDTNSKTDSKETLSPVNVLKEVKESWIMEWINSAK